MNSVNITGNLTKDPELRKTTDNTSVTSFTVAVEREFKRENQPDADFISCKAWKQAADYLCKYGHKGDHIEVSGAIRTGSYQDRNGKMIYTTEVFADRVKLRRKEEPKQEPIRREEPKDSSKFGSNNLGFNTDDLPFI